MPPVAVRVVLPPTHILPEPAAEIAGVAFTVTVGVTVTLQPLLSVPVTVYTRVDDGFATTFAPMVEDKLTLGDHV